MNIEAGQELYINRKWYADVIAVSNDKINIRVQYRESIDGKGPKLYKTLQLPSKLFTNIETKNFTTYCNINEIELKKIIGGLINRLVKSNDIGNIVVEGIAITEDGMGAVSSPTMSGTPGVPGGAGSGDIAQVLPYASVKAGAGQHEFGLQIHPASNARIRKRLKTKAGKTIIKKPIITLEAVDELEGRDINDTDYKQSVYAFLDYPVDNSYDMIILAEIEKIRPQFLNISGHRIKTYFKNFYEINKSFIDKKCSDWMKNTMSILTDEEINLN